MKPIAYPLTISIFIVLTSFISSCQAQSLPKDTDQQVKEPTLEQQIGEHIFEIFEDRKGNLWFGTAQKGVAKYNGKELSYLSEEDGLCGSTVADIAEDKNGALWFGTHMDLCKYQDNAFYTLPRKDGVPILGWGWKDLGSGWKSVRSNQDQSIWVNTHHGIFRCDDPTQAINQLSFTEFNIPFDSALSGRYCNTPGAISLDLEDSNGNFWFGTDGDGIYKYDGESFTHYNKEDGLVTNNITAITEDAQGNIWIACVESLMPDRQNDGGLCKFDGESFQAFENLDGLSQNNIYTLYTDRSGNVWAGANGVGIYRYDASEEPADDQRFTLYEEPDLANLKATGHTPGLQSILEDSNGQFWFGYSGGLFRLKGQSIINVTTNGPWK